MSLQVTLAAPIPIRPDADAVYRLDGRSYRLMNATGSWLSVHFVNLGAGPATVVGSIAGAAGALIVEPGAAFMLGWSPRDTTWRALRLVGVQTFGPEGIPADAQIYALRVPGPDGVLPDAQSQLAPAPADAAILVEALDGTTARITPLVIADYLTGRLLALPGPQSPAWSAPK